MLFFKKYINKLSLAKERLKISFWLQGGLKDVDGSWLDTWRIGSSQVEHQKLCWQLIKIEHYSADKAYVAGLEDVEGSWLETWRIGSSWTSMLILVVAKGPILKVWSRSDMIWLGKLKLGAWRTLRVPDRRLGGWGHLWHHISCW